MTHRLDVIGKDNLIKPACTHTLNALTLMIGGYSQWDVAPLYLKYTQSLTETYVWIMSLDMDSQNII